MAAWAAAHFYGNELLFSLTKTKWGYNRVGYRGIVFLGCLVKFQEVFWRVVLVPWGGKDIFLERMMKVYY